MKNVDLVLFSIYKNITKVWNEKAVSQKAIKIVCVFVLKVACKFSFFAGLFYFFPKNASRSRATLGIQQRTSRNGELKRCGENKGSRYRSWFSPKSWSQKFVIAAFHLNINPKVPGAMSGMIIPLLNLGKPFQCNFFRNFNESNKENW